MSDTLRGKLVRLAAANPKLKEHLVPILREKQAALPPRPRLSEKTYFDFLQLTKDDVEEYLRKYHRGYEKNSMEWFQGHPNHEVNEDLSDSSNRIVITRMFTADIGEYVTSGWAGFEITTSGDSTLTRSFVMAGEYLYPKQNKPQ